MAKSIFILALINKGLECLFRPVIYIRPNLMRHVFSIEEKSGLKILENVQDPTRALLDPKVKFVRSFSYFEFNLKF